MASAPEAVQKIPSDAPERAPDAEVFGGFPHDPKHLFRRTRDKICGLSPLVFWFFILVIVIIVAGAIGGGIGGGLASQHSK